MGCPEFFIVSDGRGETATRLVNSALVQFEGREVRARSLGGQAVSGYLDDEEIVREIRYANELMARRRWRSVEVSYKAIEEIAKEVAELRGFQLRIPE